MKNAFFKTRRHLLSLVTVGWAPIGAYKFRPVKSDSLNIDHRMLELLIKAGNYHVDASSIGKRCLVDWSDAERQARDYFYKLRPLFDRRDINIDEEAGALRLSLRCDIDIDLMNGNLVSIDGWLLPVTEARYCACIAWIENKLPYHA